MLRSRMYCDSNLSLVALEGGGGSTEEGWGGGLIERLRYYKLLQNARMIKQLNFFGNVLYCRMFRWDK